MPVAVLFVCRFEGVVQKLWAFSQMGFARLGLRGVPGLRFRKFMGTGTGEGFTPVPDTGRYAILSVWDDLETARARLASLPVFARWRAHAREHYAVFLEPVSSRGAWSGGDPFAPEAGSKHGAGPVAVLTRATVKPRHVLAFWRHAPDVSRLVADQPALVYKLGLGEVPWFQQVTFSIWREGGRMVAFAYGDGAHRAAVKDVRGGGYFSEELYARFRVLAEEGAVAGRHPLAEALAVPGATPHPTSAGVRP